MPSPYYIPGKTSPLLPDYTRRMKDGLGYHKVKVYKDDRILRRILEFRIDAREKYREDSIYLVGGLEGKGKSNFILLGAHIFGEYTGDEVPIENIARTIDELLLRISQLQRRHFLALDEGSELSGERFNEKKSRDIKNKFTVMRERCFIIFMAYTNPLKMNTYFREDRVRGVFYMKKPGVAWYYANSNENPHFTNILNQWSRVNKTKSAKLLTQFAPDFIMHFPEYKGKLRKLYDKRKDENISTVLNDKVDMGLIPGESYLSTTDVQLKYGLPNHVLYKLVEAGKLRMITIGQRRKYIASDIDKYVALCKELNLNPVRRESIDATQNAKGNFPK